MASQQALSQKHAEIEALRAEAQRWRLHAEKEEDDAASFAVQSPSSRVPPGLEAFAELNRRLQGLRSELFALLASSSLRCPCCRSGVKVAAENLALLPSVDEVSP